MAASGGRSPVRSGATRSRTDRTQAASSRASRPPARQRSATSSSPTSRRPADRSSPRRRRSSRSRAFAVFDGTIDGDAARRRRGRAARPAAPDVDAGPSEVGTRLDRGPGLGRHRADQGGAQSLLEGAGPVNLPRAADPRLFTDPVSLSFGDLDTTGRRRRAKGLLVRLARRRRRCRSVVSSSWLRSRPRPVTSLDVPATLLRSRRAARPTYPSSRAPPLAPRPAQVHGFVVIRRGSITRRDPMPVHRRAGRPGRRQPCDRAAITCRVGDTRVGANRRPRVPVPRCPLRRRAGSAADARNRLRAPVPLRTVNRPAANFGVAVLAPEPGAQIDPWVLPVPDLNEVQGYAGNARGREPADVRLPFADGRRGCLAPAAAGVLRRRRLRPRAVHRPAAGRALRAALVGQRRHAAERPPAHSDGRRRPANDRRSNPRRVASASDPYSLALAYGRHADRLLLSTTRSSGIAAFCFPRWSPKLQPGEP